jgi:arylsulfatase A-like enzyme
MFTGEYPYQHGVVGKLQLDEQGQETIVDPPLPDSAETLAEILQAEGYATAAFTANTAYMSEWCNLHQGFQRYEVERLDGMDVIAPASTWLDEPRDAPFFLFVNLMDAHFPYNTKPCPGAFAGAVPEGEQPVRQLLEDVLPGDKEADPSLVEAVMLQYDRGIAHADRATGALLERLADMGEWDNTLIVIASDHGEFVGEHRLAQHSKDVYEEVSRVPLLVKEPGRGQAGVVNRPVSLAQIFRTVLDTCEIDAAKGSRACVPALDSAAPVLAELYFSRRWDFTHPVWGKRFRRIRTAYYELPWKLIHSSDGAHELYDIVQDPREAHNRFAEAPERADELLARLAAMKPLPSEPAPSAPVDVPNLDEQALEALRSSGYL